MATRYLTQPHWFGCAAIITMIAIMGCRKPVVMSSVTRTYDDNLDTTFVEGPKTDFVSGEYSLQMYCAYSFRGSVPSKPIEDISFILSMTPTGPAPESSDGNFVATMTNPNLEFGVGSSVRGGRRHFNFGLRIVEAKKLLASSGATITLNRLPIKLPVAGDLQLQQVLSAAAAEKMP